MVCIAAAAAAIALCAHAAGPGLVLYVSPTGSDSWDGRSPRRDGDHGPFRTIQRALDEVAKIAKSGLPDGGIVVEVAAGRYEISHPLRLQGVRGTAERPIVIRARGRAIVTGGRLVRRFAPVRDRAVLSRLPENARRHVVQADLKALGISDFGSPAQKGLMVYFNGAPLTLARWPNFGFARISGLPSQTTWGRGWRGSREGRFFVDIPKDRLQRWAAEPDLWLHGYWFWDWSDQRQKVARIDPKKGLIELEKPYHHYGYRRGQWFYAYNALCELDSPGEWYLDRQRGILYLWPPSSLRRAQVEVSAAGNLLWLQDCSFVEIRGLTFQCSRGTAAVLLKCTSCSLIGCTVRNCAWSAIFVNGGQNCRIAGCDLYNLGAAGISMIGGDRPSLTPGRHVAENNHVHHYAQWKRMYAAAIHLNGVGLVARNNLIHHAPHQAIGFYGNDHIIELNEIYSVCMESNDAGAIYAGRDWTCRGTEIRHNYFHHIVGFRRARCVGVYLDDMWCGTRIAGNIFYIVTRAAFIGGGRDNSIENNLFVDCDPAVHVDSRAMGWAAPAVKPPNGVMIKRLLAMPYKSELWRRRYPKLVNILDDEPAAPKGNLIARNICIGGRWDEIDGRARRYLEMRDNLIGENVLLSPLPENPGPTDFRVNMDSAKVKAIGFRPIPAGKIGLYPSPERASWPVRPEPPQLPPTADQVFWRPPPPKLDVPGRSGQIKIDGAISAGEWAGAAAVAIELSPRGEKLQPESRAFVCWDSRYLYVAFENPLDSSARPSIGERWGRDEAVEIAIRVPGQRKGAQPQPRASDWTTNAPSGPIVALRGFATGKFISSREPGTPEAVAQRVARGVLYRARLDLPRGWSCEWRIPWSSLGIRPRPGLELWANLSVHKTSPRAMWLMWQATGAQTWRVDRSALLHLTR